MKKLMLVVLMILLAVPVFAGQQTSEIIGKTALSGTTRTTYGEMDTNDSSSVAFFVTYDSKETTVGVTATVTASISYDGTTWVPAYWNDNDTASTRVATKILTSDGGYYGWFNDEQPIPKIQIRVTMVNGAKYSGAVEAADVTVKVIKNK